VVGFVYTGAAGFEGVSGLEEKPRGGSRGASDTQSFRPLVQEERGVLRGGYLPASRVSTSVYSLTARCTADSILTERKLTHMKITSLVRSAALLAAVAIAAPAFAKPVTQTIQITQKTIVGKSELKAGEYRFLIDGNKVTVSHGKTAVAESEGRWEERDRKAAYTEILMDNDGQLKELRFAGKKSVFILN